MTARSMCAHSRAVDDQRNEVHRPGALVALRVAVDVVGDAVGVDQLLADLASVARTRRRPMRRSTAASAPSAGADVRTDRALRPSAPPEAAGSSSPRVLRDGRVEDALAHAGVRRDAIAACAAADPAWTETRGSRA